MNNTLDMILKAEESLKEEYNKIDKLEYKNSLKVLNAFKEVSISESSFGVSTGYGYSDMGREQIEKVFSLIFGAEDALVRSQFISGSQALTVCLFAILRPGDTMLSISGLPYDTLHEVIGIRDNPSSLKSFNINYEQIDLVNDDFDDDKIIETIKNKKYKLIEIQRSKGYSTRKSLTIDKLERIIKKIKKVDNDIVIMVDNCYCEFVEDKSPIEVGADVMVGSFLKNLGAGICQNGGYILGKKNLVELAAERLNLPGEGKEVGPSLGHNKEILMGLYHAPSVVASALKTAVLTSKVMEDMGYKVEPRYNDLRADIVQNIFFGNREELIKYAEGIQGASAIDANAAPIPTDMPGYKDQIIMASGSFMQGSSIEISCDAPLREPFILYQQGSLTYQYGKIALENAINKIKEIH